MRYLWTRVNDDPDYDLCVRHGINGLFAPLGADGLTSRAYLQGFVNRGFPAVGVYIGAGWWEPITPEQLASKVVNEFLKVSIPKLKLQMNIEKHDPPYILRTLQLIRKNLPKTGLSWSPEGFQGGWMGPDFVDGILRLRIRVVPQTFTGDMRPQAQDQVLRNLTRRGFPESIVSLFYDARHLPIGWNGYAFDEGRLPR